jgi:hypothetical protein
MKGMIITARVVGAILLIGGICILLVSKGSLQIQIGGLVILFCALLAIMDAKFRKVEQTLRKYDINKSDDKDRMEMPLPFAQLPEFTPSEDEETTLREQGVHDLRRAVWWCKREWFCILLGVVLTLVGHLPFPGKHLPLVDLSPSMRVLAYSLLVPLLVGLATGIVGGLLSLPSSFFAFLGILFPGKSARHRFLLLFLVSALPLIAAMWVVTNGQLIHKVHHDAKGNEPAPRPYSEPATRSP